MLARDNVAMTYANEVITNFYTDLRERRKYEAAERYVLDRNSLWNDGIREGISLGRAEGISQRNLEIARNMKNLGFALDDIIKATQISQKDLESL